MGRWTVVAFGLGFLFGTGCLDDGGASEAPGDAAAGDATGQGNSSSTDLEGMAENNPGDGASGGQTDQEEHSNPADGTTADAASDHPQSTHSADDDGSDGDGSDDDGSDEADTDLTDSDTSVSEPTDAGDDAAAPGTDDDEEHTVASSDAGTGEPDLLQPDPIVSCDPTSCGTDEACFEEVPFGCLRVCDPADTAFFDTEWGDGVLLSDDAQVAAFAELGCEVLLGSLRLASFVQSVEWLEALRMIDGHLILDATALHELDGLGGLRRITGTLWATDNHTLESFAPLRRVTGMSDVAITRSNALTRVEALAAATELDGLTISDCPKLEEIVAPQLESISGSLSLSGNTALRDLTGLGALQRVDGSVYLTNNGFDDLTGLGALQQIGGDLHINGSSNLLDLSGLEALERVGGELEIARTNKLRSLGGLSKLRSAGSLSLWANDALLDFQGLSSLTEMGEVGVWNNAVLQSFDGLTALQTLSVLEVGRNPVLERLGLPALVRVGELMRFEENGDETASTFTIDLPALTSVGADVEAIMAPFGTPGPTNAGIDLWKNYGLAALNMPALERIPVLLVGANSGALSLNASSLEVVGILRIADNPDLTSLSGFGSLAAVDHMTIEDNDSLAQCEANALAEQVGSCAMCAGNRGSGDCGG